MNKYVALQMCEYDDENNACYTDFIVPREWFDEWLKDNDYEYDKFMNEYTSVESSEVYCQANLNGKIIKKNMSW